MTIAKRLRIFILVQLTLLAVLATFSWHQLTVIRDRYGFLAANVAPSLAVLGHLGHDLIAIRAKIITDLDGLEHVSNTPLLTSTAGRETFSLLRAYRAELIAEPAELAYLEAYQQEFERYYAVVQRAVETARASGPESGYAMVRKEAVPLEALLLTQLDAWTRYNEQLSTKTRLSAEQAVAETRRNLFAAGLGLITLSAWFGVILHRQILRPVRALQGSVQTIARGEYSTEVPFKQREDETGQLAQSIEVLRKVASETESDRWVKMRLNALLTSVQSATSLEEFSGLVDQTLQHELRLTARLVPIRGESLPPTLRIEPAANPSAAPADPQQELARRLLVTCFETRQPVAATNGESSFTALPLLAGPNLVGLLLATRTAETDLRAPHLLAEFRPSAALILQSLQRRLDLERQTAELEHQHILLRQTEAWFRQVLENTPEGILVADTAGKIVFCNQEAARLFGYPPDELAGLPLERLLPAHGRETRVGHQPLADCAPALGGAPLQVVGFGHRKDGSRFAAEAEISRMAPVAGKVGSFCVSLRDITARRQAEVEMAKLSRAVEQTSSIVLITDLDGNIEYANPQFTKITGYTLEEVRGQNTRLLKSGLTPAPTYADLWSTISSGQVWRGELINRKKSGELYPESLIISPITDPRGRITHYVAIKEDITVRKQTERRVLFNRFVVENSGPMLWLDPADAQCLYANQAALAHFGYTAPEFLGLTITDWNPDCDLPHFTAVVAQARTTPRTLLQRTRHRKKDGSLADVEANVFLAQDEERSVLVVSFQDISERVLAEQAIQRQRAQLQRILDTAPVGVAVSIDGIVRFSNPRMVEMLGFREGSSTTDAYTDPSARSLILDAVRRHGTVRDLQLRMRRPSGELLEVLGTYMTTEFEGQTGLLGWLVDVSTLKAAEAEILRAAAIAEAATRAKSDFLANMSHEIRTPMNAIIGMTHLALKAAVDPRQRNYLKKVDQSADHLLSIVNDILDFSKIEAGKLTLEHIEFSLDAVVASVSDFVGLRAAEKKLELLFRLHPDTPSRLVGDPLRLKQILLNLAGNAAKFTEQGTIIIGAEPSSRDDSSTTLHFWVSDTGIGLTPAQLGSLFQTFSQADTSTTRRYGGSGLGLAICRKLVELMHGRIWAESTAGAGSTFHFEIPLGLVAEPDPARMPLAQAFAGRSLLLADDNPAAREILAEMSHHLGLHTDVVPASAEALARLQSSLAAGTPYRFVLLDARLPGLADCLAHYHQLPGANATAVILLAPLGDPEADLPDSVRVGPHSTLAKPITPSALFETLGAALAGTAPGDRLARPTNASLALAGLTLLVAEDNALNLELALELLESAGARVLVAHDGREAVDIVRAGTPVDAVLMDCQMPILDGYDATRQIRQLPGCADLPIIALTANVMGADVPRAIQAGMNDLVAKPIDVDRLIATVLRWSQHSAPSHAPVPAGPARVPVTPLADESLVPLGAVPGLRIEAGLRCCDGNAALYQRLLATFRSQQAQFADHFAAARAAGDHALTERLAHTLKGTAGTIGAIAVQQTAAELEAAVRDGAPAARLDELATRTTQALGELLAGLATALPPTRSTESGDAPLDVATALRQLDELAALIAHHDPRALATAAALERTAQGTRLASDVARLKTPLANYEFEPAAALLEKLRATVRTVSPL